MDVCGSVLETGLFNVVSYSLLLEEMRGQTAAVWELA